MLMGFPETQATNFFNMSMKSASASENFPNKKDRGDSKPAGHKIIMLHTYNFTMVYESACIWPFSVIQSEM